MSYFDNFEQENIAEAIEEYAIVNNEKEAAILIENIMEAVTVGIRRTIEYKKELDKR